MDASYGPYGEFSGRGFHVPRRSFDNPNLDEFVQHDIVQQQLREEANSPGHREAYSSGSDSPSPPVTHQQTSNQPYAPHFPPGYLNTSLASTAQSTSSPNVPQATLGSADYFYTMPFGPMPSQGNAMGGSRHHSIE